MNWGASIFLSMYFLALGILALFGWHRYRLTYLFLRHRHDRPRGIPTPESLSDWPTVTVQLPLYNEKYVVQRLLEAVMALDYPRDRLQIQVLDDSTDETVTLAKRVVDDFFQKGFSIEYRHRQDRQGFKAGALQEGLKHAWGEYIAIFDADFLPKPDFLKRMIPYFLGENRYGMVQARWSHLNQNYSFMTQAQSVLLDGHFVIEHFARNRSGCFFNFNGTAGVWDRRCIDDAGGWQGDTLTEDLDLSYRAQMRGWKFLYVPEVDVAAELPVEMNAFKAQQHRWAKGAIQTAFKLLRPLIKSPLPWKIKAEAAFHLLNNFAYVFLLFLSFMMPLSLYLRDVYHLEFSFWIDFPVFILATLSFGLFYAVALREVYPDWKKRLGFLPLNLALGIGLAVNNSRAVLEAVTGKKTPFQRTAKFAIAQKCDRWQDKKYKSSFRWTVLLEIFLGLYFMGATVFAVMNGRWTVLYSLLLFQLGFLYVGGLSWFQGRFFSGTLPRWQPRSLPSD